MAITQMELVNMAHLAAIHEGKPHDTVDALQQHLAQYATD